MRKKGRFSRFYLALIIMLLYLPIVIVILYSFNSSSSTAIWGGLTLDWYGQLLQDGALLGALWVSAKVAFLSALLATVIGTLGAVALNRLGKRTRLFMTGLSYVPIIIPEVVLGVALLMFFSVMPFQYGIQTLVISHTAFCIPYVLFMVQIRLMGIDPSIMEAAVDLGATPVQLFFTVTLPLIFPAVISGTLLAVAMSLDDVVISFFVVGPGSTTLPVKIFSMIRLGVTPEVNALCTLLLLFTFISIGVMTLVESSGRKREGELE